MQAGFSEMLLPTYHDSKCQNPIHHIMNMGSLAQHMRQPDSVGFELVQDNFTKFCAVPEAKPNSNLMGNGIISLN
jgi:hypothetical protein